MAPAMPSSDSVRNGYQVPDFRLFIWRFFEDPEFQVSHVHFPLRKERKDPNRGFAIVSEMITKQAWKHLPGPEHYRCAQNCYDIIIYDNFARKFRGDTERVLALEGSDNGINNALYFKLESGEWMLVKWEDMTD